MHDLFVHSHLLPSSSVPWPRVLELKHQVPLQLLPRYLRSSSLCPYLFGSLKFHTLTVFFLLGGPWPSSSGTFGRGMWLMGWMVCTLLYWSHGASTISLFSLVLVAVAFSCVCSGLIAYFSLLILINMLLMELVHHYCVVQKDFRGIHRRRDLGVSANQRARMSAMHWKGVRAPLGCIGTSDLRGICRRWTRGVSTDQRDRISTMHWRDIGVPLGCAGTLEVLMQMDLVEYLLDFGPYWDCFPGGHLEVVDGGMLLFIWGWLLSHCISCLCCRACRYPTFFWCSLHLGLFLSSVMGPCP